MFYFWFIGLSFSQEAVQYLQPVFDSKVTLLGYSSSFSYRNAHPTRAIWVRYKVFKSANANDYDVEIRKIAPLRSEFLYSNNVSFQPEIVIAWFEGEKLSFDQSIDPIKFLQVVSINVPGGFNNFSGTAKYIYSNHKIQDIMVSCRIYGRNGIAQETTAKVPASGRISICTEGYNQACSVQIIRSWYAE